jgi:RimJ/RimL family protein N-acetyltransferase
LVDKEVYTYSHRIFFVKNKIAHLMILKGKRTLERAIHPEEFFLFYTWATQPESTSGWYGARVPSSQEARSEWQYANADNNQSIKGRSLVILADGKPIDQINYNEITRICHAAAIDVLIGEDLQKGKGYGSDAIRTLVNHLFQYMQIEQCELKVLADNTRAIQAYLRLGFEQVVSFVEDGIAWQKMVLDKKVFFGKPAVAQA